MLVPAACRTLHRAARALRPVVSLLALLGGAGAEVAHADQPAVAGPVSRVEDGWTGVTEEPVRAQPQVEVGTLEVAVSAPGATVSVDGGAFQAPPWRQSHVLAGTHEVVIAVPGQDLVVRGAVVWPGTVTRVDYVVPPAEARVSQAITRSTLLRLAWRVLTVPPWLGFVLAGSGTVLLAAVAAWNISPGDLPTTNPAVPDGAWTALRWGTLAGAVVTGALASVVLLAFLLWPPALWEDARDLWTQLVDL